ncbi:MAG TPA: MFS transporter [Aggregatilineales bacterium]|nr:MFS transporter [Anaerolineales bacterium]HRE47970.1 MFS transporter [Aggregatilineales bacterium]
MPIFVRDRFTWLGYLLTGYLAYMQAVMTPAARFLSSETGYSYTERSLHLGLAACGGVLIGLVGDRLTARVGRFVVLWGGAALMLVGMLIAVWGMTLPVTLGGALLSGLGGAIQLITIQAAYSDLHGVRRSFALTESNIIASFTVLFAPVLAGELQRAGIGWRGAIYLPGIIVACIAIAFWRTPIPPIQGEGSSPQAARRLLPFRFWLAVTANGVGTAAEWSTIFWASEFLEKVVGFAAIDSVTLLSLFFLAMLAGRFVGSRLARHYPPAPLFVGAFLLALVGFLLLWQAKIPTLNVIGLFITGLGIANLYPQGVSLSLESAPGQANTASARNTLFVGMAIFTAPLILGGIGDQVGIFNAYGFVVLFLAVGAALALAAFVLVRRENRGGFV